MNCSIVFAFLFAAVSASGQIQYENRLLNDRSTVNSYRNRASSIPSAKQQIYMHLASKANSIEEVFETMKVFGAPRTGKRGNRFAKKMYLRRM